MSATHRPFDVPALANTDSGLEAASAIAHTDTPMQARISNTRMKNISAAQLSQISVSRTLLGEHRVAQCRSQTEDTPSVFFFRCSMSVRA